MEVPNSGVFSEIAGSMSSSEVDGLIARDVYDSREVQERVKIDEALVSSVGGRSITSRSPNDMCRAETTIVPML